MSRRVSVTAGLAVLLAGPLAPAAADVVERRGVEPSITGAVTLIDDDGVTLRSDSGAEHFVPWDRVRRVEMTRHEPSLDERMRMAADLWRARARVQRGDFTLAEPLLERLFETYRGRTHVTARMVAEGLLRCRLARGANELAVIPALEVARLQRAGIETESFVMLPAVLDDATALCPELAPAWSGPASRPLRKLERDLAEYDAADDVVVADLGGLYLAAARRHLGTLADADAPDPELVESAHPGVALLARVVGAVSDDPARREAARDGLLGDLDKASRWAAAWSHFAVGSSLLLESGIGRQQRGMVHLLHVPARHRTELPYLAGLSVAHVADASRRAGDTAAAAALDEELRRSFPGHPLLARPRPASLPPTEDSA